MKMSFLLVLAAYLAASDALSCYTCHSTIQNEACFNQVRTNPTSLEHCTFQENFCKTEVHRVNDKMTSVTRGCAPMCEEQQETDGVIVKCCQSDGCNSAGADAVTDSGAGAVFPTIRLIIASVAVYWACKRLNQLESLSLRHWG